MRDYPEVILPKYSTAVFLDRDGTINVDCDYPHRVEDLVIMEEAIEGLKILTRLPVHIIIVSNQAGIALNKYKREDMTDFNKEIRNRLNDLGVRIDAFYYCPHLEKKNLPEGAEVCKCSKPMPGLILEAASDYNINIAESYMVGDKLSDIMAGFRAGCKANILVKTGKAGQGETGLENKASYTLEHLKEAAVLIEKLIK